MATKTTQDLTDIIAVRAEQGHVSLDRAEVIKAIRVALKRRTGRTWSVTGGRGTGYGWLTITAPPKRRTGVFLLEDDPDFYAAHGFQKRTLVDSGEQQDFGYMTPEDIAILSEALGTDRVGHQGVSIPSGSHYWEEYVARAEGRAVARFGEVYWD